MDRSGLVGEDGATHQGLFDLSYLRHMPNMVLMAPADENELQNMLKTALAHDGPAAIRYPRGEAAGVPLDMESGIIPIGRGKLVRRGTDLAILAIGNRVAPAVEAAAALETQGVQAAVVNCRFVKPLDRELILRVAGDAGRLITVEENVLQGGFGSAVLELLADEGLSHVQVIRLGVGDRFVEHASPAVQRSLCGVDTSAILQAARALVSGNDLEKAASR
jgi:1-deoxy-D-xylulose-5-phosphate synthase